MLRMMRNTGAVAALAVAAGACEARPAADGDDALAAVSPELLQELKERYPTLREEPAPEPQPSGDARPEAIPPQVRETVATKALRSVTGEATFYADKFEGRRTASGIPFRQNQLVAAHRAYPFGTLLRVTNMSNDRSVNVRVVDRGPFGAGARAQRTVIDLSRRAAQQLGYIDAGRAQVRVEVLEWGEGLPRAG
jgi:rare lipoprotein A